MCSNDHNQSGEGARPRAQVPAQPQAESCPNYGTPSNYRPGDDPHPVM